MAKVLAGLTTQQAPNWGAVVASITTGRIHTARIDVEAVHIASTVPSRGPEVAAVTLTVGLTGNEVAREGRNKGGLEVGGIATILSVEVLEFPRTSTSR